MRSVKVKKAELLNVVTANRQKHLKEYESASQIFLEDAIAKLTEMLTSAKKDGKVIHDLGLVEPRSFADSYDTAIKMLEMSTEDVIELTQAEFVQYVEDRWHWKESFIAATSVYNAKLAR